MEVCVGSGARPLHFAARKDSPVLSILLERGADVKTSTREGNTPLHYAVEDDRFDNVVTLLQYGSAVNFCNYRGETPLLMACRNLNQKIIELLLQHGADPNRQDENDISPLTCIVMHPHFNNFEIVDVLLRFGANINQEKGVHSLALLCSNNSKYTVTARNLPPLYNLIVGLIMRGAEYPLSGWFEYINHAPTLLKLGVWTLSNRAAATSFFFTFVYGEEKGVRPVPIPRRLTGAYGLYPIRRRLASYLVHRKSSVRGIIQKMYKEFTSKNITFC
jgi:hypothetical protein